MEVINIRKSELNKKGFKDFEEWQKVSNHLYIGRNMTFYVKGTNASKWQNPFSFKKQKLSAEESLKLYEQHIRSSTLIHELHELEGKVLGCWCKPNSCHGDILIKLLNESKQFF